MNPIILRNKSGIEVHILKLGAIIQRLIIPTSSPANSTPPTDNNNTVNRVDIALGFDDTEPYRDGTSPYFGAIVGRVANRIANATFSLNGKTYTLAANNGPNCLHGGIIGFSRVEWEVIEVGNDVDNSMYVTLGYLSPDLEEGFPGRVTARVTYTLTDNNTLRTEIQAESDEPTPVNLAQHTYFNLRGHNSGTILDHTLHLPNADYWTPVNDVQIPTGEIIPVQDTPMDFLHPQRVGDRIAQVPDGSEQEDYQHPDTRGYDHNYVLFNLGPDAKSKVRKDGQALEKPRLAAILMDPESGRGMRVSTTTPGVQFYSGNFLDGGIIGKNGCAYVRHAGLCLETQGFPDSINQPDFPNTVLEPGITYRHIIEYEFFYS